ncbi:hypothetical protein BpHYR1_037375 [Brachionus plicatilis]|uniref:Uncharacterized protein n=1 Tax=Brachionus plicatilis TaxID=10195 RepID=A0A3M7S5B9_BRAPC|nr:hypothetical protein BpHYR1_037375 [Brachionus plicatilis]
MRQNTRIRLNDNCMPLLSGTYNIRQNRKNSFKIKYALFKICVSQLLSKLKETLLEQTQQILSTSQIVNCLPNVF